MLAGVTDLRSAPAELATGLGLGRTVGAPANLKPGDANPVWSVVTTTGRWVVKTQLPAGPWWFAGARRAHRLERAASEAGILVPRPADPLAGAVGFWSHVGEGVHARAMRHLDGHRPAGRLGGEHAAWAGRTLALLERAGLPVDPAEPGNAYRAYRSDEWDAWLGEATAKDILDRGRARRLARLAAQLAERMAGHDDPAGLRLLHRDLSRYNILVTAAGPALLDFDHAGAQRPWWEVAGHAVKLATADLTTTPPDEDTVRQVVRAYLGHGGSGGPSDEGAFTGLLAAQLSFAAWQLWIACGHRDSTPEFRVRCAGGLRRAVDEIDAVVRGGREWAGWLRP
jgi:Ser/Thr protein kinase RdoA (MazF antagonist)